MRTYTFRASRELEHVSLHDVPHPSFLTISKRDISEQELQRYLVPMCDVPEALQDGRSCWDVGAIVIAADIWNLTQVRIRARKPSSQFLR